VLLDSKHLNNQVIQYQLTGNENDFNEIYQSLAKYVSKTKFMLKRSYGLEDHEAESIINFRLFKTVATYDPSRGDFIRMLMVSIRNECIDTVRRRPKHQIIDNVYCDQTGTLLSIFEDLLIEGITRNADEEISKKLIKESDQRQLIATLFERADKKSQEALIALSECGSFYRASKKLGTCNKTIERRIRKIAKLFERNQMGSIYDYFTVSTRPASNKNHTAFLNRRQ